MQFRPATPADALPIATLWVRTRRLAYEHFFPPRYFDGATAEDYLDTWMGRVTAGAPDGMQTYVADGDDALACFVHCGLHEGLEPGCGEIEFFYVAPERHGTGLADELMQHAVASMRAQGCTTAVLWVFESNARARRFYERVGWAPDGATRQREVQDWLIPMLRYRRRLV